MRSRSATRLAPWKSWTILADIETDAGNPAAAAEAKRKAIDCYLAYRRDGGENHDTDWSHLPRRSPRSLRSGDAAEPLLALSQRLAVSPKWPTRLIPFVRACSDQTS